MTTFATKSTGTSVHLNLYIDVNERLASRRLLLLKELEGALLGNIASLLELAESLEARGVLLLGNNATLLGLHQILLGQATGSVLGRTVPNLRLRANRHHLTTRLVILTSNVVVHFYTETKEIKTWRAWEFFLPKFHQLKRPFFCYRRLLQSERANLLAPTRVHSEDPSNTR